LFSQKQGFVPAGRQNC